jgi:hypothetical protein
MENIVSSTMTKKNLFCLQLLLIAMIGTPAMSAPSPIVTPKSQRTPGQSKTPLGILCQVIIKTLPTNISSIISQQDIDKLFADRYNYNIDSESVQAIVN